MRPFRVELPNLGGSKRRIHCLVLKPGLDQAELGSGEGVMPRVCISTVSRIRVAQGRTTLAKGGVKTQAWAHLRPDMWRYLVTQAKLAVWNKPYEGVESATLRCQ